MEKLTKVESREPQTDDLFPTDMDSFSADFTQANKILEEKSRVFSEEYVEKEREHKNKIAEALLAAVNKVNYAGLAVVVSVTALVVFVGYGFVFTDKTRFFGYLMFCMLVLSIVLLRKSVVTNTAILSKAKAVTDSQHAAFMRELKRLNRSIQLLTDATKNAKKAATPQSKSSGNSAS